MGCMHILLKKKIYIQKDKALNFNKHATLINATNVVTHTRHVTYILDAILTYFLFQQRKYL